MYFPLLSFGPSKGLLSTCKRTRFGIQKDPFYIANVVLLQSKRTTFGMQYANNVRHTYYYMSPTVKSSGFLPLKSL